MEILETFSDYFDTLLLWHVTLGVLFAAVALSVNQFLPYSFSDKPKDIMLRKFVFYGILILVAGLSFIIDTYYVSGMLVDDAGLSENKAKDLLNALNSTRLISLFISLIVYSGLYYGLSLVLKNSFKKYKCFSVFKFK